MDKISRNKATEGGSSDEEEAFESADEGEETSNSVKPTSATSADIASANSTLKELVGKNDASTRSQVTSGQEKNSGKATEGKRNAKMDNDIDNVEEEHQVENLAVEKDPSLITVITEQSPSPESTQTTESRSETEEDTDKLNSNPKLSEDETEAKAIEGNNGDTETDEQEVSVREEQSPGNEDELVAEENIGQTNDDGKNEVLENSANDQQKCSTESSSDVKVEDNLDSSAEKPTQESSSPGGGWGWGGWTSMLSHATASVTSGLSSVIETVETSLGVPDPEEVARKVKAEEKLVQEKRAEAKTQESPAENKSESENEVPGESFFSGFGVSSLTSVVQSTGKELMSGGLDALEFIGKKTMNVLAEGDPGLRQKREKLSGKGPSLSQVLKEAKEVSEQKAAAAPEGTTPTVDLFSEFDKFQGLAHLEALEMLSRDSEAKLESCIIDLTEDELSGVKPLLRAVEEVFHIDENDEDDEVTEGLDFKSDVIENVKSLNLLLTADKIVTAQERARKWIAACVQEQDDTPGSKDGVDIYTTAVSSMAELTARTVELFHKFTELLLHQAQQAEETSSLVRAHCVRKMTDAVLEEISVMATHFAGCLNTAADDSDNPDSVSSLITTLYLDSSTSADYLRNSLKLLRPVLQLSSLDEKNASKILSVVAE